MVTPNGEKKANLNLHDFSTGLQGLDDKLPS